jgi:hypothetical protein
MESSSTWFKPFVGFASGAVANIGVHPFETLRAQKQAVCETKQPIKTLIISIYRKQGLLGFYRGLGYAMLGNSIFYGCMFNTNQWLHSKYPHINSFISGYVSSCFASVVINLFQVLKTHRQVEIVKSVNNKNKVDSNKAFIKNKTYWKRTSFHISHHKNTDVRQNHVKQMNVIQNNVKPFLNVSLFNVSQFNVSEFNVSQFKNYYRGLRWTFIKNVEVGFIMKYRFQLRDSLNNYSKSFLSENSSFEIYVSEFNNVFSTFLIKWGVSTLTYPLDTARVLSRTTDYSSFEILSCLYKNFSNSYRGYWLYSMRSVPSTVITFVTYEKLMQWVD